LHALFFLDPNSKPLRCDWIARHRRLLDGAFSLALFPWPVLVKSTGRPTPAPAPWERAPASAGESVPFQV